MNGKLHLFCLLVNIQKCIGNLRHQPVAVCLPEILGFILLLLQAGEHIKTKTFDKPCNKQYCYGTFLCSFSKLSVNIFKFAYKLKMSNSTLLTNPVAGKCLFCSMELGAQQGVKLQECLHLFCRGCLQFAIQMQKESIEIPCPVWHFLNCGGFLTDYEVKQLVRPEIYQEYVDRSLAAARKIMKNVFSCKTEGCAGWCEFEPGRRTFLCPICNQINCMDCKIIHTYGVTCAQFRKSQGNNHQNKQSYRELVEKEKKTGWGQLMEMVQATGDSGYHEKLDLLLNNKEFECSICFGDIEPGDGVILHECLHMFCRNCLIRLVEHNEQAEVKCPFVDENESCWCFLQPREIKALVPQHILEKHLQRSVKLGESGSENSFHCKTPDCPGWCVYDKGVTRFRCPRCRRLNCIPCKVIHEGISCHDFINRGQQNYNDRLSEQAVNDMVRRGEYMRCPRCRIPLQKIVGCDWLMCTACRTEICWATRGPRWGPGGKGDLSGGCGCGPGRPCHPACTGCH